jgi:hypothetical protein
LKEKLLETEKKDQESPSRRTSIDKDAEAQKLSAKLLLSEQQASTSSFVSNSDPLPNELRHRKYVSDA